MRPSGRARAALRIVSVLVVGGAMLSACGTSSTGPTAMVQRYLAAWSKSDYTAMAALVSHPPADFVAFNRQVASDLDLTKTAHELRAVSTSGTTGTANVTSDLTLGSLGTLKVRSRLRLSDASGAWKVQWSPSSIIPALGPGDSVSTSLSWPARAPILGMGTASLTTAVPMVSVGIEGSRVTSGSALMAALTQIGVPATEVKAAEVTALAHPTWFVQVAQLSQAAYEQFKPVIFPVPGTVFNAYNARGALTPELAAHVVGTVGPITAEELQSLGPLYAAGDMVGQSGIEQADERQLAGTPGAVVSVIDRSGNTVAIVGRFDEHPGTPVQTTIDPGVQKAAESALSGQTLPAAIVAIQASTGDVLASVSTPDSEAVNEAFDGAYPPGSTFKIVTSSDLLEHGLTPSSPATCPSTITVNGQVFHNFEGETTPSLSMQQAFAMSCNTAFIGMSSSLPDPSYSTTAAQFGIGSTINMGLTAFGGRVPVPTSTSDAAATAIGQAQVVVSPLTMANVAATVDSGSVHLPRLVSGAPDDSTPPQTVNPTVVSDLRTMMNAVVTSSVGTAASAGLPAGTFGKTGTAEFGMANPPQTDAWFIGYNGDLAFAVLVVGGGVGGAVAAPIAAKFLATAGSVP
jgi:Penicillin binding protein transpeptidase domain/Penicillin-binding Protein dimerisation domain/NTF2-like N-terminal transpeptidase domain